MRKSLKKYGAHGRTVRVLTDDVRGGTLVRVRWREGGRTRTESWPDTKENRRLAIAFAETTNHRLAHRIAEPPPAIALSALFAKYCSANTHWRPTTLSNAQARWKKFELVAGPGRMAHSVTPDLLDRFRAEMRKIGHAPNQTVEMVKVVRAVFRFAKLRRLIGENPLDGYTVRLAKDEQRTEMFEYTPDEWAGLLAQLSPRKALQWRAYCLLTLGGLLGPRQNALRHLTWDDLDLDARTVTWRRGFDKLGKERPQPLPRDAVRCFRIARVWARRDGYNGRWVFYGAQERTRSKPYTYQALNAYLRVAEEKAGINHIRHRAMHGLRRTAAGNALEASGGNIRAAGDWIGDSDLRTLSRYLKRREVRQRELAAVMSAPRAAVTSADVKANRHQNVTAARQEAAEEELSAAIAP